MKFSEFIRKSSLCNEAMVNAKITKFDSVQRAACEMLSHKWYVHITHKPKDQGVSWKLAGGGASYPEMGEERSETVSAGYGRIIRLMNSQ